MGHNGTDNGAGRGGQGGDGQHRARVSPLVGTAAPATMQRPRCALPGRREQRGQLSLVCKASTCREIQTTRGTQQTKQTTHVGPAAVVVGNGLRQGDCKAKTVASGTRLVTGAYDKRARAVLMGRGAHNIDARTHLDGEEAEQRGFTGTIVGGHQRLAHASCASARPCQTNSQFQLPMKRLDSTVPPFSPKAKA